MPIPSTSTSTRCILPYPRVAEHALDDGFQLATVHHVRFAHQRRVIVGPNREQARAKQLGHVADPRRGPPRTVPDEDRPRRFVRRIRRLVNERRENDDFAR